MNIWLTQDISTLSLFLIVPLLLFRGEANKQTGLCTFLITRRGGFLTTRTDTHPIRHYQSVA